MRKPVVKLIVITLALILLIGGVIGTSLAAKSFVYYVKSGDTLYLIATRFGTTVQTIMSTNGLTGTGLYVGQKLVITPTTQTNKPSQPAPGGSTWTYTVKSGDTLFLIAQRFGTTVTALRSLNNLSNDYLSIGQRLKIPGTAPANPPTQPPDPSYWTYTVKSGDTLFLLAQRFGTTIDAIRRLNNFWVDNLYVGQQLKIPGSKPPTTGNYPQSDIELLARLVRAEAGGEPYVGQVAVAATVLNRVRSGIYPTTIREVIYQVVDGKYVQYEPVLNGTISLPASDSAWKAVGDALSGWDPSLGALGFYNPQKTNNAWVASRPVTIVIGNHIFFK